MNFLPYEQLIIKTHLKPEGVYKRLTDTVEDNPWSVSFWKTNAKTYQGKVELAKFKISRRIFYRNSFLPVIIGEVLDEEFGSSIRITMRLDWFIILFILLFLIWLGNSFLSTLANWILFISGLKVTETTSLAQPITAAIFICLFYGMVLLGFKPEVKEAKKFLSNILKLNDYPCEIENAKTYMRLNSTELTAIFFIVIISLETGYILAKAFLAY